MRKILFLLLIAPLFTLAQAPTSDSTKLTAPPTVTSFTPSSWYQRGGNASNAQIGYFNSLTGKWSQLVTGYQFNHYTGASTLALINSIGSNYVRKDYIFTTTHTVQLGDTVNNTTWIGLDAVNKILDAQVQSLYGNWSSAFHGDSLGTNVSHYDAIHNHQLQQINLFGGGRPINIVNIDNATGINRGMEYDVHPNFYRSTQIPDIAKVDSMIGLRGLHPTNGLQPIAPDSIGLGSPLTQNTAINGGGYVFSVGDFVAGSAVMGLNMIDTTQSTVQMQTTGGTYVSRISTITGIPSIIKYKAMSDGTQQGLVFGVTSTGGTRQDRMYVQDGFNHSGFEVDKSITNSRLTANSYVPRSFVDSLFGIAGTTKTLQQVTTAGNTTTKSIFVDTLNSNRLITTYQRTGDSTFVSKQGGSIITNGNSITAFSCCSPIQKSLGYANQLSYNYGVFLSNIAVPSTQITTNSLTPGFFKTYTSSIRYIFNMWGTNEIVSIDTATYHQKYRALIDTLTGRSYPLAKIVILGMPYTTRTGPYTSAESYAKVDSIVAIEKGTRFIENFHYMKANGGTSLLYTDGIHPTTQGQNVIAGHIITVLADRDAQGSSYAANTVQAGAQAIAPYFLTGLGSWSDAAGFTQGNNITGGNKNLMFDDGKGLASGRMGWGFNTSLSRLQFFAKINYGINIAANGVGDASSLTDANSAINISTTNATTIKQLAGVASFGNNATSGNKFIAFSNGAAATTMGLGLNTTGSLFGLFANSTYNLLFATGVDYSTMTTAASAGYVNGNQFFFNKLLKFNGGTSGIMTVNVPATFTSYNFNLPATSGANGQVFTSGGGSAVNTFWGIIGINNVVQTPAGAVTDSVAVKLSTTGKLGAVAVSNFAKATIHSNSTTTGTGTTAVTVTIGSTMANTTYNVTITPRDLLTAVNYYISAQTTTTFTVTFISAITGSISFDYNITP